jgi:hypothetical protein
LSLPSSRIPVSLAFAQPPTEGTETRCKRESLIWTEAFSAKNY